MVKMIRDNTGRFAERPFYAARDLDNECERLIHELLMRRHGRVDYPVADSLADPWRQQVKKAIRDLRDDPPW